MTREPAAGPAIVTTLRAAGTLLDDFIDYHLAVGFSRLYLVFDDPSDPDIARVTQRRGVEAIASDAAWRVLLERSPLFNELGASVGQEVMARQILNASAVADMARIAGHDWLVHIDVDELFLPAGGDAGNLFSELSSQTADVVCFANMEAVPERADTDRPFAEVSLFKVPVAEMRHRVAPDPALADTLRRSPRFSAGFFNLYSNGKAAVRLSADGIQPFGVHDFARPDGSARRIGSADAVILHYACCGLEAFEAKYRMLGRFSDRWWNRYDIAAAIGPFHLQARDVVMAGDEAEIAKFYQTRVAMIDPDEVAFWQARGLLRRLSVPAELLARTQ